MPGVPAIGSTHPYVAPQSASVAQRQSPSTHEPPGQSPAASHRRPAKIGSIIGQYVGTHGPDVPMTTSAALSASTSATIGFSVHVDENLACEKSTSPPVPS